MNKLTLYKIITVILIVANLAMVWLLMSSKKRPRHGDGPRNEIIKALNFDKGQVEQYDKLIALHRKEIKDVEQKMNNLKTTYFLQLNNETNIQKNDSLLKIMGEMAITKEKINYLHFEEIRKICKPDQLPDFNNLVNRLNNLFAPHHPPH